VRVEHVTSGRWRAAAAAALALSIATAGPGCALLASANAAHSRITPCVGDPIFAMIDLGIGIIGAVSLLASGEAEESPAWLAAPGVFVLSGVIGSITAYRCRRGHHGIATPAPAGDPPAAGSATGTAGTPAAQEPPVTPLLPPPDPAQPGVRLQLDPDYLQRNPGPEPPPPRTNERTECSINPLRDCPPDHSCVLVEGDRGYCAPDR
jgi:hypothetical protein